MVSIKKTFRVPSDWANRHGSALFSSIGTYGKYVRGLAMIVSMDAVPHGDGSLTIRVELHSPCRPTLRIVGRRRAIDTHQRADIRKILKMLTVAHNKAASAA
jgi:hypothetical protein